MSDTDTTAAFFFVRGLCNTATLKRTDFHVIVEAISYHGLNIFAGQFSGIQNQGDHGGSQHD